MLCLPGTPKRGKGLSLLLTMPLAMAIHSTEQSAPYESSSIEFSVVVSVAMDADKARGLQRIGIW